MVNCCNSRSAGELPRPSPARYRSTTVLGVRGAPGSGAISSSAAGSAASASGSICARSAFLRSAIALRAKRFASASGMPLPTFRLVNIVSNSARSSGVVITSLAMASSSSVENLPNGAGSMAVGANSVSGRLLSRPPLTAPKPPPSSAAPMAACLYSPSASSSDKDKPDCHRSKPV